MSRPAATILTTLMLVLTLSACSSFEPFTPFAPFRVTIDQGNIVTQEDIALVTLGMTKQQVRFLIGSPILLDISSDDIWTYYYQDNSGINNGNSQTLTLTFENERLVEIRGAAFLKEADLH